MPFSARRLTRICCTKLRAGISPASARARTRPRIRAKSAARAASSGGRRAPAARASVRFVRRCGVMAARSTDPSRATIATRCPKRCSSERSAPSAKLADQKLTVVDAWSLESHKTKGLRATLDKLAADSTALIVDHGENRNLELASRNLDGVKLSAPSALQPYEVLRHDRLVLSKDAAARLAHSLDPQRAPVEAPHVETIAPAPAAKKESAPKKAAAKKPAAKKSAKPAAKKGKK